MLTQLCTQTNRDTPTPKNTQTQAHAPARNKLVITGKATSVKSDDQDVLFNICTFSPSPFVWLSTPCKAHQDRETFNKIKLIPSAKAFITVLPNLFFLFPGASKYAVRVREDMGLSLWSHE